jgi:hypothetical protein
MLRKTTLMLGALVALAVATPALAGEVTAKAPGLAEMAAWAKPLSDGEMGELRGGYAGFAFNVIMTGTIEQLTDTGTGGVTSALPPGVTVSDGMVNVQTAIGSFNGASGVFQLANLENSSFNVINQNLFVQIAIIDVASSASIPTIQSLLDGTFTR